MLVSVVIITRNEAPRLRLVLESFANQDLQPLAGAGLDMEVVVVDDGSTDHTPDVLAEAQNQIPLHVVRHPVSLGRSPSRNGGVRHARGDVVLLFDGDCLASRQLVARHAALHHRDVAHVMGRGETFHIRDTRFFYDPETGSPMPGQEEHVRRMGSQHREACITRAEIRDQFEVVAARAQPGIYAGGGPRKLYELEMRALSNIPDASILWMTAPGQNFSIRRRDFLEVGGYDERLSLNEHRELAFRLYQHGAKMRPVEGARSIHLLHRVGWRDPLVDTDWEQVFYDAHPCLATKLMTIFWLSLARDNDLPESSRIESLEDLEAVVQRGASLDYDAIRRSHPKLLNLQARQVQAVRDPASAAPQS